MHCGDVESEKTFSKGSVTIDHHLCTYSYTRTEEQISIIIISFDTWSGVNLRSV